MLALELMALNLFNTLTRSVREFVPLDPAGRSVGMYCCGPTVYDYGHIGNFRTFIFADLVRRHLEFKGFSVRHVMNITDVEDKIIRRVRETGKTLREYTGFYEAEFLRDLEALHCLRPTLMPRATEHIPEIIDLIGKLLERGVAYKTPEGSIYFSIDHYRECGCRYGQLVNLKFDQMRPGARVATDDYDKESIADFALWKARVPEDGDVFWPSPWGEGRPGWHIECSAMSMKVLGPSFDLHLGGEDLVFPHHEDEIAQSEGAGVHAPGQRFVQHWMHGAHLLVEGKKMAKSLGNFFTLRDLAAKGFAGREVRYLLLTAHYRETFNFTQEGLEAARAALARIDECLGKLRDLAAGPDTTLAADPAAAQAPVLLLERAAAALDEDLNVSGAWGAVFDWVRDTNRWISQNTLSRDLARKALAAWERLDTVFGLGAPAGQDVPAEVLALAEARQAARKARDFARADAIRDELKTLGWGIEDTPKGPKPKRL